MWEMLLSLCAFNHCLLQILALESSIVLNDRLKMMFARELMKFALLFCNSKILSLYFVNACCTLLVYTFYEFLVQISFFIFIEIFEVNIELYFYIAVYIVLYIISML